MTRRHLVSKLGSSVTPWHPQDRVGPYVLSRMVASGGMAEVWEARLEGPVGFAKRVAIKRLMSALSEDQQFVGLFLDEARLMAGLTHPHICQVIELGERDGSYWVAMEFLAGATAFQLMRETVKRGWRVPLELAVLICRDTAEALAYAHAKTDESGKPLDIIHRDVSPQNIMVTYEGVVKLVDFGIARAANRTVVTETGQLRGKLAYMPPEQARGDALDGRADQFSLGVTLFELVTHTRLYGSQKEMDLFREVAMKSEPLPTARSRLPEVPDTLEAIIARMLERDPDKRFESMAKVRDELSSWLTDSSQSIPGSEALARYMAGCFPPESRPAFTTNPSMPIVSGRLVGDTSAGRAVRRDLRPLYAVGAGLALVLVGGLVWSTSSSEPPPVAPVAALAPVPATPPVVDAGAVVALVEPPLSEPELADADDLAPLDKPAKSAKAKKAMKPGFLTLQTTPWTLVFLGKKNLGETPLSAVALPVGVHRLRLVNEERKLSTTIEVEIKPGQTTTKRLSF